MKEYEFKIAGGEIPADAIRLPAEDIDHRKIVLRDGAIQEERRRADRDAGAARILAIYRENGGEDMDFGDYEPPRLTPFRRVNLAFERVQARFARWWLWNLSYPVRTWFHFRFNREKPLPNDRQVVRAMLRDAFAREGITDYDLPYAADRPVVKREVDKPGRFDLFFNRKRVIG